MRDGRGVVLTVESRQVTPVPVPPGERSEVEFAGYVVVRVRRRPAGTADGAETETDGPLAATTSTWSVSERDTPSSSVR